MTDEKCFCGHSKKSHRTAYYGSTQHHGGCKICKLDCIEYSAKSDGRQAWERWQLIRQEGYGTQLPPSIANKKWVCEECGNEDGTPTIMDNKTFKNLCDADACFSADKHKTRVDEEP